MSEQDNITELVESQIVQKTVCERELSKTSVWVFLSDHQWVWRVKYWIGDVDILNGKRTCTCRWIVLCKPSKRDRIRLYLREHHVLNQRSIVTRMRDDLLDINQIHSRIPSIDIRNVLKVSSRNRKLHCLLNINIIRVLKQLITAEWRICHLEHIQKSLSDYSFCSWKCVSKEWDLTEISVGVCSEVEVENWAWDDNGVCAVHG